MFYVDHFEERCIGTEYKFLFLPKKCFISGKTLWLQRVYKRTAMYMGPDDTVFEHRYYDKHEYLINQLKKQD